MEISDKTLANRILVGLVIGVVAGIATLAIGKFNPASLGFMQTVSTNVLDPFGQVFLRMLFFVVIPLVFASLASGVLQLGRLDKLGPLAGRSTGQADSCTLIPSLPAAPPRLDHRQSSARCTSPADRALRST